MEKIREDAACTAVRLFLWNEKLTRNQISDSEGLCVCLIRSHTYVKKIEPFNYSNYCNALGEKSCRTVIPFDLSKLLNKDSSLGTMLVSATLQFKPETIKHLGDNISSYLFTQFQYSQAFLQPPPRPTYVIALEISHLRFVDDIKLNNVPPSIPFYCRFKKDWLDKDKGVVTIIGCLNDPYYRYPGDVLEYIKILRTYTGEGGICPTKPPISLDVARGFVEVKPSPRSWCPDNNIKDLTDDTCAVCHEEFTDEENEVIITTYCTHPFHASCLLPWLSKKNTCPTCRAVYPLHYSPVLDRQRH